MAGVARTYLGKRSVGNMKRLHLPKYPGFFGKAVCKNARKCDEQVLQFRFIEQILCVCIYIYIIISYFQYYFIKSNICNSYRIYIYIYYIINRFIIIYKVYFDVNINSS